MVGGACCSLKEQSLSLSLSPASTLEHAEAAGSVDKSDGARWGKTGNEKRRERKNRKLLDARWASSGCHPLPHGERARTPRIRGRFHKSDLEIRHESKIIRINILLLLQLSRSLCLCVSVCVRE